MAEQEIKEQIYRRVLGEIMLIVGNRCPLANEGKCTDYNCPFNAIALLCRQELPHE